MQWLGVSYSSYFNVWSDPGLSGMKNSLPESRDEGRKKLYDLEERRSMGFGFEVSDFFRVVIRHLGRIGNSKWVP